MWTKSLIVASSVIRSFKCTLLFVIFCGYSCQQPAIVSVRLCDKAFEKRVCISHQEIFDIQTTTIYLSCRFIDPAPDGTASISLHFLGEGIPLLIQEKKIPVGKTNAGHVFNHSSKFDQPASGWREGSYLLSIKSDYGSIPLIEKPFTIKVNL